MLLKSPVPAKEEIEFSLPSNAGAASDAGGSRIGLARFDYILLASLWLLTYPLFRLAKLPYAFDITALTKVYMWMLVEAFFFAIVIGILGLPLRVTVLPFLDRLRNLKALVLLPIAAAAALCWVFGAGMGIMVFADSLALAELSQRCEGKIRSKLFDLIIPGVYLFVGLVAVFAFNHGIVGIRYGGTQDAALSKLDSEIFNANASEIAHWGFRHLPMRVLKWFDFIYFSAWSRLGAALTLVAVLGGRKEAIKFVRNILVCYVIALMVFAMIPAKGPYSINKTHFVDYPKDLSSYGTQQALATRIKKLYAHTLTTDVRKVDTGDYYVSFPSLHAALPLIALWFLRRWRRLQKIAICFYILLLFSIIFLGWHYLVDFLGGWGVACLSIVLTEWISRILDRRPAIALEPELVA